MSRSIAFRACVVSIALVSQHAFAVPMVDIATGLSLSLNSGSSGTLTMAVQNSGDASAAINFYQFAVMLIPTSGTGTLTLDSWGAPASNPLLGDPVEYTPLTTPETQALISPVTISGTDYYDYYPLAAANTDATDWLLDPAASKNVGLMSFTAGPADVGTVSTWDIYVVSQSYTAPQFPPSFIADAALTPSVFGNLLGEDGANLKIGTVTIVSVPEPGTTAMLASGMVCAALAAWRRRKA